MEGGEGKDRYLDRGTAGEQESDDSFARSGSVAAADSDAVAAAAAAAVGEGLHARESEAGVADAVDELDDIVTGINAFVDDSRAGLEGAEVEAVGGNVSFDVEKFMSLLNGDDLMCGRYLPVTGVGLIDCFAFVDFGYFVGKCL